MNEVWQTTFRALASYTIPKIDVLVSAIMRSQANAQPTTTQDAVASNGQSLNANYDVTSAQVQAAIGRPLPAERPRRASTSCCRVRCTARASTRWTSALPRCCASARTRTNVGLDLYNLFNANTGTAFNQGFGDGSIVAAADRRS